MVILDQKLKRKLILLMTGMFFVGVSATDIYVPSLPEMVKDFNATPSMLNLTLAAFSLAIAVCVLFSGEFSNRFGRRSVLLFGVGVFALSALAMSFNHNLKIMIFLRVLQALGAAVILIVPRLILKDSMDEQEQIRANGFLLISLIISPAIAPIIGARLAYWFGWRSCFIVTALATGTLYYWAYRILPETNIYKITKFKPVKSYLSTFVYLLSSRIFLTLTLVYACGVGAYFTFIGISSYLYIKHWDISPIHYSYIFLGLSLAYLIGNQLMQKLNSRSVKPTSIIALGVYSTLLGCLLVILAAIVFDHHTLIFISTVTIGVLFMRMANALINPPTQIMVMNYFNKCSAQALGLNMCLGFAFSGFATYVVTIFPDYPFLSFIVISSLFIFGAVLVFIKNRWIVEANCER